MTRTASTKSIYGQWLGKFEGESIPNGPFVIPGSATLNIEYDRPGKGFVCIDQGNRIHGSRKDFTLEIIGNKITGHSASTIVFDFNTQEVISIEESLQRQGNSVFYFDEVVIDDGFIDCTKLNCKWRGRRKNQWLSGTFSAKRLLEQEPSAPEKIFSWGEFKQFISNPAHGEGTPLFRGHPSSRYRLRTSLHREHRYDLMRYRNEACEHLVQHVNQHVNTLHSRQFDIRNQSDLGSFISLAQHHGFPTPLLDWTKSPYIAAFFAFEQRLGPELQHEAVRIFIFDIESWQQDTIQDAHLADPRPIIALREFHALNNARQLPQQAVHTYTNLEDIEAWIRIVEGEKNKRYLTIIDIPRSEREIAMRDLRLMGVTAATLFPGLDGVCRSLREQFFPPIDTNAP